MTERQFFVIYGDDDGGHIDGPISQEELVERLIAKDGSNYYGRNKFLDRIGNFDYWTEDALVIIEGKIIKPTPIEITTTYEI